MEQLTGVIDGVRLRNGNGFIIFELRLGERVVTVTGTDQELFEGDVVVCTGEWVKYDGKPQFKTKTILPQIPTSKEAIEAYILAGRIKGISTVLGKRLVEAFGVDLLYVIENEPAKLKKVKGFGPARIKDLTEGLRAQLGYRSILLFLSGFGLGTYLVKKIHDVYTFNAVNRIKENPYKLCTDIPGVGFTIADSIGRQMNIAIDDPDRILAGLVHSLEGVVRATGSTGVPEVTLVAATEKLLKPNGAVEAGKIKTVIPRLVAEKHAMELEVEGAPFLFPVNLYWAERGIAKHVKRLLGPRITVEIDPEALDDLVNEAQSRVGKELSLNQRRAVKLALCNPLSIITGGPGTGKTTIMRVLLECCRIGLGAVDGDMLPSAPTGKASKRLEHSTGLPAFTIHRALGFSPDGGFNFNEECQLPFSVIVVDEFSMTDTMLCYSLIQAVATGTRLVFVGDVDQLESVGAGRVLKDMIDSEVIPYQRLTDLYRTSASSMIALNATEMNNGRMPILANGDKDSDFWFLNTKSDEETADTIIGLIDRLSAKYGFDPFDDIQVLTPMRMGAVGMYELNNRLQKKLNGKNLGKGIKLKQDDINVEFCLGDKVMHVENNQALGVMNGEVGRVIAVDVPRREVTAMIEGAKIVYAFADLAQLRLNYAQTIHKSQGSEYPCVIIPCSMSHYNMLFRSIFYTGTTRAKQFMVYVGELKALKTAISRVGSERRLTGLKYWLEKMAA
ncbi:SF1B family DNA helicase RecD2 [Pseudomonas serbica]|uniref:SF1B family DNA helicase RecD2 n=1 Tax=Pseudomonas serbica TaxID=2965074 RepID=UPI003CCEEB49